MEDGINWLNLSPDRSRKLVHFNEHRSQGGSLIYSSLQKKSLWDISLILKLDENYFLLNIPQFCTLRLNCVHWGVCFHNSVCLFVLHVSPKSSLTNMKSLGKNDRTAGGICKKGKRWGKNAGRKTCAGIIHSFKVSWEKTETQDTRKRKFNLFF